MPWPTGVGGVLSRQKQTDEQEKNTELTKTEKIKVFLSAP